MAAQLPTAFGIAEDNCRSRAGGGMPSLFRSDSLGEPFKRFLDQTHMVEHRRMSVASVARDNRLDDLPVLLVRAGKAAFRAKLSAAKRREPASQPGRKIGNDVVMSAQIDLRMQFEIGGGKRLRVILLDQLEHGFVESGQPPTLKRRHADG